MKIYTKESLIKKLIEIRDQGWILTNRSNNDGGIGNTLEDLLGIEENNLPIPNAAEWELKAQRKNTSALLTLFHSEPSPRALKFVPSVLLPLYGWSHKKAGKKYPNNEKSFRQTIRANKFSDRGFSIKVDRKNRKIVVLFNFNKIDKQKHSEWMNEIKNQPDIIKFEPKPYWGFDDLFHKAGTKLYNCFLVLAKSKKIENELYFLYEDIYMLKNFKLDTFINALEEGKIFIDFDARSGHNHGTKFRIKRNLLLDLYSTIKQY